MQSWKILSCLSSFIMFCCMCCFDTYRWFLCNYWLICCFNCKFRTRGIGVYDWKVYAFSAKQTLLYMITDYHCLADRKQLQNITRQKGTRHISSKYRKCIVIIFKMLLNIGDSQKWLLHIIFITAISYNHISYDNFF